MRTLFVFLAIGLVFTLVQYSNGAPTDNLSWDNEEDASAETKIKDKLQSANDGDTIMQSEPDFIQFNNMDESSETKSLNSLFDELSTMLEESDNKNNKVDNMDNDKENVKTVVNDDYQVYDDSEYDA